MSETNAVVNPSRRKARHRGRLGQVPIYLGKQFRFFINESDWKVIPMSAVIAALVAMVVRKRFFVDMEGGLMSAFALTCVGIWNGCFNSIQSICRERAIIKREHRSGMHITSYIAAHMIYQLFLCVVQSGVSIYVMMIVGIQFPAKGFMTSSMMLDLGLSLLLISYASDMLSLFVSSIAHTTTGAMTVMPFVLIFQLVFSGGVIPLPAWSKPLSNFTISNYGIRVIAAQTGYNELPMTTPWNTLTSMRNTEINADITMGQVLDVLNSDFVKPYRDMEVIQSFTVGDVAEIVNSSENTTHWREKQIMESVNVRQLVNSVLEDDSLAFLREKEVVPGVLNSRGVTVGDVLKRLLADKDSQAFLDQEITRSVTLGEVADMLNLDKFAEAEKDTKLNDPITLGQVIDFANGNQWVQDNRGRSVHFKTTVGALIDFVGVDKVKEIVTTKSAEAARIPAYDRTIDNVMDNWLMLGIFIVVFALMATISLKFIDKDKR